MVSALDFARQRYILSVRLPGDVPADKVTRRMTTVAGEDAATVRARCLDIVERTGEWPIVVEVVPGRSDRCVGVSMVVAPGRHGPLVAYCVRRLQLQLYASDPGFVHPYELGANVYCESVRDDEAMDAATRFVRAARFYGAITVEFRRDARDGGLTLIKADPRGSVPPACRPRWAWTCRRPSTTPSPASRGPRRPRTGGDRLALALVVRDHRRAEPRPRVHGPPTLGGAPQRAPHPCLRLPEPTRPAPRPHRRRAWPGRGPRPSASGWPTSRCPRSRGAAVSSAPSAACDR